MSGLSLTRTITEVSMEISNDGCEPPTPLKHRHQDSVACYDDNNRLHKTFSIHRAL